MYVYISDIKCVNTIVKRKFPFPMGCELRPYKFGKPYMILSSGAAECDKVIDLIRMNLNVTCAFKR